MFFKINITNVINVFETFAGIGAQHKAINNIKKNLLNIKFKIIGTSEWDARAIISYSQIHHQKIFKKKIQEVEKWNDKEIKEYLSKRTFSLDSKKSSHLKGKNRLFKNNLIAANIVNNNFPDINKVSAKDIEGTNLLTYSFPCQGLSIANMGRAKGIKQNIDSTSNLIWQINRILEDVKKNKMKLPKYLLLENVKTLVGKTHKKDFDAWKIRLSKFGYKTYYTILNGLNHGSLQKRERVFAISILGGSKLLEKNNDFKNKMNKDYKNKLSFLEREKLYKKILNSSLEEEKIYSTPNNTKSRRRMAKENNDLLEDAKRKKYIFNTLTTKQDRHPNIGMIQTKKRKGKLDKRFITPREGYQIMGFSSKDFDLVKKKYDENILTKESLYRQSGNSIIVTVLEDVFKFIDELERGKNV